MTWMPAGRSVEFTGPSAASKRHVHAPVLRWHPLTEAERTRVRVADADRVVWDTDVSGTEVDLAPVWDQLPLGRVDVLVQGLDADGAECVARGHRGFAKVAGWDGDDPAPTDWLHCVRRTMDYLLAPARDAERPFEVGLPRNVWSSYEDNVTGDRGPHAYPAQHSASYIRAFTEFARAFPDDERAAEAVRQARQYGDWLLANRLPDDWRCAGLPYSTISLGQLSGGIEGQAISVFRAGRAGEALIALFDATGEAKYLDGAVVIADQLESLQSADGSWPYRIDPRTGEVVEQYSSSVTTPIRLFALVDQRRGDEHFLAARKAAEQWLIDGPVTSGLWQGQYEDITEKPLWHNLQNWDTNEAIRYLLSDSCEFGDRADRIAMAQRLNEYIEDQFVMWQHEAAPITVRCPTPTVLEQYDCYHPMESHTAHWLLSLQSLHHATGEPSYLAKAVAAANSIVAGQAPNGNLSTWGFDQRFGVPLISQTWPGCNAIAVTALLTFDRYRRAVGTPDAQVPGLWGI